MFKRGNPVSYRFAPMKKRQATIHELAKGSDAWILEKQPEKTVKGVIGILPNFYLPVKLEDGKVVQKRPDEIKERGKAKRIRPGDVVSFKTRQPTRIKLVNHRETEVIGKIVTVTGKVDYSLNNLHIPVVVDGDTRQIRFEDLTFKETK